MIVKWDKPNAGIKVIPAQNEDNRILGNIMLLPGYNEVNDVLWESARKNIKNDPEGQFITEVSKVVKTKELPEGGIEENYKKEELKKEDIPDLTFDKMVRFLQANNFYKEAVVQAKEKEVDFDVKFIKVLIEESSEEVIKGYNEFVGVKPGDEAYLIPMPLLLGEVKAEEALIIVNDTWNMETLEAWRKVESRDEIRSAIANQIEEVNKPNPSKQKG